MKRLFRFFFFLAALVVILRVFYPQIDRAYQEQTGLRLRDTAQMLTDEGQEAAQKLLEALDSLDLAALSADLKPLLDRAAALSDTELRSELSRVAERHGVRFTDGQLDKLVSLCRSLQGLEPDALRERLGQLRETLETLRQAKESAEGMLERFSAAADAGKQLLDAVFSPAPGE